MTSHKIIIFLTVIGLSVGDLVPLLIPTDDNQQTTLFEDLPTRIPLLGGPRGRNSLLEGGRSPRLQKQFNAHHSTPIHPIIRPQQSVIKPHNSFRPRTSPLHRINRTQTLRPGTVRSRRPAIRSRILTNQANPGQKFDRTRTQRPGTAKSRRPAIRSRILTRQGSVNINPSPKSGHQQVNLKDNVNHVGYNQKGPLNLGHEYIVDDHASGNHYSHSERRNGNQVTGTYYVHLPDGRKQTVTYYADETGYHPTVTYERTNKFSSSTDTNKAKRVPQRQRPANNKAQRVPIRPRPASIVPHHNPGHIGFSNESHQSPVAAHHQTNQDQSTFVFPQDSSLSNYNPVAVLRPHQG